MRIINLFLIILIPSSILFGQDLNRYYGLESKGNIPEHFLITTKEKFKANKKNTNPEFSRTERKTGREFTLVSTFFIDRLNKSGLVLYGDTISIYLNKIKDILLSEYPRLSKKINIYTIRYSSINAFATPNGDIYFNVGLIAKVNNEAELAFIISHEIMHIVNRHHLEEVIYDSKINSKFKISDENEFDTYLLKKHMYSRQQELSADKDGYLLFSKSQYSSNSINSCFKMLNDENEIYDKLNIDSVFANTFFDFAKYYSTTIENFNPDSFHVNLIKIDTNLLTHPNIEQRKNAIISLQKNDNNNNEFILPKEYFLNIKLIANFELVRIYLEEHDYLKGLLHTYALKKSYSESQFLSNYYCKYLLKLAEYKYSDENWSSFSKEHLINNISYLKLNYLIDSINKIDFNILACAITKDFLNACTDNVEKNRIEKVLSILTKNFAFNNEEFLNSKTNIDSFNINIINGNKFINQFYDNSYFNKLIKSNSDSSKFSTSTSIDLSKMNQEIYLKEVYIHKNFKLFESAINEEIDTILISGSFDYYFKFRRKIPIDLIKSEKLEHKFSERIKFLEQKVNSEIVDFSNNDLQSCTNNSLHNYYVMNKWLSERLNYNTNIFYSTVDDEISSIIEKHKCKYGLWNCVISVRDGGIGAELYVTAFVGLLVWPYWPQLVSTSFQNLNRTYYMSFIFDFKTGNLVLVDRNSILRDASNSVLAMYLYNTLSKMHTNHE